MRWVVFGAGWTKEEKQRIKRKTLCPVVVSGASLVDWGALRIRVFFSPLLHQIAVVLQVVKKKKKPNNSPLQELHTHTHVLGGPGVWDGAWWKWEMEGRDRLAIVKPRIRRGWLREAVCEGRAGRFGETKAG